MMVLSWVFAEKILIAMAIGALLGMEREHTKHQEIVGIRTFSMISLLGVLCVEFDSLVESNFIAPLGFASIMVFAFILYSTNIQMLKRIGLTTSIAMLISYSLGAIVGFGFYSEAIFVGIAVAFVMFARSWLHKFVGKLTHIELLDFLEFLVVVGIVYPIIPKEPLIYFGVRIDLYAIWLLVVLISFINLLGFIGSRYLSADEEVEIMSFLGGLISSTAICFSVNRVYEKYKEKEDILAGAYPIINGAMFTRNLVILAVFAPVVFKELLVPFIIGALVLLLTGYTKIKRIKNKAKVSIESPFGVQKAVWLALKLFIIMTLLQTIVTYLPNVFYLGIFFGAVTSSAATMASIATMFAAGEITSEQALLSSLLTVGANLMVGNLVAYRIAGATKRTIKKAFMYSIPGLLALVITYLVF